MPTIYNTEAICLRTFPYQETSLIIHCVTPEQGRISVIAKGAKRHKSPLAGACEALSLNQLQLKEGKSLDILYQYQSLKPFWNIRQNMFKLACANLMAELVYSVTAEGDADSTEVFELLKQSLLTLENPNTNDVLALAYTFCFQTTLLALCGYQLGLSTCVVTHEFLDDDRTYYPFSPELGGLVSVAPQELQHTDAENYRPNTPLVNVSLSTIQLLRDPLQALKTDVWEQANLLKVHRFLQYALTYRLEHQIKSYNWLGQELAAILGESSTVKPQDSRKRSNTIKSHRFADVVPQNTTTL